MRALAVSALLILVVSCAGLRAPSFGGTASVVHFCEITSHSEDEPISLVAVYRHGFEESALVDASACQPGFSFWVEFSPDVERNSDPGALRLLDTAWGESLLVRLRGSYQCFRSGVDGGWYGPLNRYACQFTVTAIEHVFGRARSRHPALEGATDPRSRQTRILG